ncbi:hypothetical protein C492_16873 [Natronococcus jeotgali DSM 18795]|uniref:Uncharacterized protein n=1 Tax=Natronococcus jeotgali DSM 18795 TaxID=1227498 RepID=L9WX18_9EURY|nr:hypothetical protein C492_16873 [Natronococcus jeotgali DSM 18795]
MCPRTPGPLEYSIRRGRPIEPRTKRHRAKRGTVHEEKRLERAKNDTERRADSGFRRENDGFRDGVTPDCQGSYL